MNAFVSDTAQMETQILQPPVNIAKEDLFTGLVNQHLDEIHSFARYMVLDNDEAEDIAQKTFLSLYQNIMKLDLSVSPRPWLYKVCRNHCLDYLKKKKSLQFSDDVLEQVMDIPESDPSLDQRLDDELFQEKFKGLVRQLPVQYREVLLLRYFQDATLEQIAEALSQPLNTVKSNFYRGKAKLYQLLKD